MRKLALIYRDQGRLAEAENLQIAVVKGRKQVLGEEDPATLRSMGELALIYHNQCRLEDARELLVPVVEGRKRVLGKHHQDTRWAMKYLASLYREEKRDDDAEILEKELEQVEAGDEIEASR